MNGTCASRTVRVLRSTQRYSRMMATSTDTAGRREYYPLRAVDIAAIVLFWLSLAVFSSLGRQLDPRITGLPPRVIVAVVRATHV